MPASLQILTLIAGAYLLTYWLCTMLDYAEQLPEWLTPRLAALAVTFLAAWLWMMHSLRSPGEDSPDRRPAPASSAFRP